MSIFVGAKWLNCYSAAVFRFFFLPPFTRPYTNAPRARARKLDIIHLLFGNMASQHVSYAYTYYTYDMDEYVVVM